MKKQERGQEIYNRLETLYPDSNTALNWETPWQLLVAVILSAQNTDVLVNKVTEKFFKKYPDHLELLKHSLEEVTEDLKSINYYKNKSKFIYHDAELVKQNNGKIPLDMNELLKYMGVGRKVANVVINELGGNPQGAVVDTHVMRLSQRLGLTKHTTPPKIEIDLMKLYTKNKWRNISHMLIFHGRAICKARNPLCEKCILNTICPSAFKFRKYERVQKPQRL